MSWCFSPKRIPHVDRQVIRGFEAASGYLRFQARHWKSYQRLADLIGREGKAGEFLEVGCGPGYQTALVARAHPETRICVLEPSRDMLVAAKNHLESQGLSHRVRFVEGYVEDEMLVKSLGSFDLVYSTFSLHHWVDPCRAFENICEVLRPQGTALIYDVERHWLTYYFPFRDAGVLESVRAA
ncbi:MAG: class I SAM-dependent methyltransferase, partial [Kiritimatiellae bacterium]|nr:class I SAM-dependent methyltransferase [Kiritimatiellia bacterium]